MAAPLGKNVVVDPESLRRLARRLGVSQSAAIRYAVERLLHEDEVMQAADIIRRRGGLDDVFGRASGDPPV